MSRIAWSWVLLLLVPSLAPAQEIRGDVSRVRGVQPDRAVWVVSGGPAVAEALPEARPREPAPPTLSGLQKSALLADLRPPSGRDGEILEIDTKSGPWRVHPARPVAIDRAHLRLANVRLLDTRPDAPPVAYLYAIDPDAAPTSEATLVFSPVVAGARYLFDCTVGAAEGYHRVRVEPGGAEQTFAPTDHLLFVYEATDASTAEFTITGHGQTAPWRFYGCEITPLTRSSTRSPTDNEP